MLRRVLSSITAAAAAALALLAPGVAAAADPVIAGAGDISCGTSNSSYNGGLGTATACRQKYTSDLLVAGGYAAVFTLGDNINDSGSLANFQQAYDPTWGRVKAVTHPNLGNHEGTTASGYCTYFGAAAHCNSSGTQAGAGFYSWDVGAWHVVVVNSNCSAVGGCDVGSAQYTWLQHDLATHPTACTLAYWHHPRFSSGHDGSNTFMQPIWRLFYDNGADLVLSGHSHDYERFAPMDGTGNLNRADGMRQFVVGTGGAFFTGFGSAAPNSEVRNNTTFGVVALTLHPTSYDWRFVPEAGKTFTDSGSQSCRGPAGDDNQPPEAPTGLTATASSGQVTLSWTAASDNVGVVGYDVLRGPAGGTLAKIGTSTGTTFVDQTVSAGQDYDYQVLARDAAGNVSQPSNKVTVTTPSGGGGTTLSFTPVADASVKQASPTSNFGTSTSLNSDSGSGVEMESYLRFSVTGVGSAAVASAKLRLYVPSDGTADGPGIYGCTDSACATWSENAIAWNTRPPRASNGTADTGQISGGTWVEYDVTPLVHGDGTHTLVIGPTPTTDGVVFSSREATANKPQLLVTPFVDSGYARPIAATPITFRLVPAFQRCEAANATHGYPLVTQSCSPPAQSSQFLTVGTPDANGQAAGSTGVLVLQVVGESPIDPSNGDQADIKISGQITDVRNRSDLSDYTGELEAVLGLRITDRLNGPNETTPATVTDTPLRFTIGCTATPDSIGGQCNVMTTVDSVTPGIAIEGKRSIWELSRLEIYDGGPDGIASTPDNTLFAVQGLFAP